MSAWQKYIDGFLVNKQLPGGKWLQKASESAAIVSHAGAIMASTPGFALGTYVYDMHVDDKTVKKVPIDEKKILTQVALTGSAAGFEAGIRINNMKYMLVRYDPGKKLAYFSKIGGGACAMATKSTIVFASYNSTLAMSDGKPQNPGVCNEVVEKLGDTLVANKS